MNNTLRLFGLVSLTGLLTGCDTARQTLGLDPTPPDEFTIMKYAPLSMPPEYTLRPPVKGGSNAVQATETKPISTETLSPAQKALLNKAGAGKADHGIKAKLKAEGSEVSEEEATLAEKITGSKPKKKVNPKDVLNAVDEAERLNAGS